MNALRKVFSGGINIVRVNSLGLILMLLGVVLALLAGKLHLKLMKLLALLVCAGGALLAILG